MAKEPASGPLIGSRRGSSGRSWVDQLTDWVDRLPGPTWAAYLVLWVVLLGWVHLADWIDGGLPVGSFRALDAVRAVYVSYFLALLDHLDGVAASALAAFRPALEVDDEEYESLRHGLTTMPQWPVVIAWLVLAVPNFLAPFTDPRTAGTEGAGPVATTTYALLQGFSMGLLGVVVYHTVRQARMVARIHAHARRIDLFDRRPLHAFSRLTARAGLGLALPILLGTVIALAVTTAGGLAVYAMLSVAAIAIAAGSFILPLRGMRDRLVTEKRGHQADCESRIKATIADLHRSVDERDRGQADALNKTLASLLLERDFLARLPTWPWDPSTLGGFITALLVPIVIWGIIRILERFV